MEVSLLIERYFTRLEAGDFVGAASCFGETARYSHPPYADEPSGAGRHEVFGREAILALFRRRGVRATRHEITTIAQVGERCFISGIVKDADAGGAIVASFVSETVVDAVSNCFAEYVAYSSRPAVWGALGILDT
jgi:ketosteroid isomerase-like protein